MVPTTSSQPRRASPPFLEEHEEEDDRRGQVRRHEEGQEVVVVLVDVPAQQARQDDRVAEARDRERLGDTLQQPEDDRLSVGDRMHGRRR
jgi:hypothetical protein